MPINQNQRPQINNQADMPLESNQDSLEQSNVYNNIDSLPPSYEELMKQNKIGTILITNEQDPSIPLPILPNTHITGTPSTSIYLYLKILTFFCVFNKIFQYLKTQR